MERVGPFFAVLLIYMMGAINAFYAIGHKTIDEAFLIMYRLVIFGDLDLTETANEPSRFIIAANGTEWHSVSPVKTPTFHIATALVVVFGFVMGTSLMNIFIAVLGSSYE